MRVFFEKLKTNSGKASIIIIELLYKYYGSNCGNYT